MKTLHGISLVSLKTYIVVMLFLLMTNFARTTNAKVNGKVIAPEDRLPRVTAVNGQIEIGQIITVDVDQLSNWSVNHDPRKLVPFMNMLGVIFVSSVYDNLTMPKFNSHLLALMAISAGVYVAFEVMNMRASVGQAMQSNRSI